MDGGINMNKYTKSRLDAIKVELDLQKINSSSDLDDSEFVHDILKHIMETYEFDFEGWTDEIEEEILKEERDFQPTLEEEAIVEQWKRERELEHRVFEGDRS